MLGNLQDIRRENAALQAQVEAKNRQIAALEATLNNLTSNQEEVSSRVTNLLSSIEDWEKSLEGSDAKNDIDSEDDAGEEAKGGGLFSLGD
jgi:chromosome segregation ATPase